MDQSPLSTDFAGTGTRWEETAKRKGLLTWVQAPGCALLLAAFALALVPGHAGAIAPQIAEVFQPSGGTTQVARGAAIIDQTTVEVKVPANTILKAGQPITILECEDADGTADDLPTDNSSCDGLTSNNGPSLNVGTGGTIDKGGYEIYQLPSVALSELGNASPVCNATTACVFYVGQNYNDFTQPYVWSTPFYVRCPTSATCDGRTTASTTPTSAAQPTTTLSTVSTVPASGSVVSTAVTAAASSQLAATGPPETIDGMLATGVVLLVSGSLARRRLRGTR